MLRGGGGGGENLNRLSESLGHLGNIPCEKLEKISMCLKVDS